MTAMRDMMAGLFASGRVVDGLLALVALEAAALLAWRRLRGHGPSPLAILCNLAAGAALMMAVRAALTGADWTHVALWLLAALPAHGVDLAVRFGVNPVSLGRREPNAGTGTSRKRTALAGRS